MSVIVYNSINNSNFERLYRTLEGELPDEYLEKFDTIRGFSERICHMNRGKLILIIVPYDMEDFNRLFSIKKNLNDIRIILVLPDRSAKIVSAGYKLRPRFISYADSDFYDVTTVIKRMMKLIENNPETVEQFGWKTLSGIWDGNKDEDGIGYGNRN